MVAPLIKVQAATYSWLGVSREGERGRRERGRERERVCRLTRRRQGLSGCGVYRG